VLYITDDLYRSIAEAQLLNLPITVLGLIVIAVTGIFADNGRLPRPVYPLSFLTIILACYAVLVVYPSNGAVYAATMIGNAVTAACESTLMIVSSNPLQKSLLPCNIHPFLMSIELPPTVSECFDISIDQD
jgi:hypothetical protein